MYESGVGSTRFNIVDGSGNDQKGSERIGSRERPDRRARRRSKALPEDSGMGNDACQALAPRSISPARTFFRRGSDTKPIS